MSTFIKPDVSDFVILLIIGVLLFGRRLPGCFAATQRIGKPLRGCLRVDEPTKIKPPARSMPGSPVPPWLLAALAWLWREFYFWTVDDLA
jgi:hypothetical protein